MARRYQKFVGTAVLIVTALLLLESLLQSVGDHSLDLKFEL
jgi:hypothetical protein